MRARRLLIDDLPDEVLVYDLDRHQAHCLNQTAALIWRQCDGRTSVAQIARRLEKELKAPVSEELVWLALRQLTKLHLLEEPVFSPPQIAGISRRQMVRSLGIAAAVVALPLVTSIVSPTQAQTASCALLGLDCSQLPCCGNLFCDVTHGFVCIL